MPIARKDLPADFRICVDGHEQVKVDDPVASAVADEVPKLRSATRLYAVVSPIARIKNSRAVRLNFWWGVLVMMVVGSDLPTLDHARQPNAGGSWRPKNWTELFPVLLNVEIFRVGVARRVEKALLLRGEFGSGCVWHTVVLSLFASGGHLG